MIDSQNDLKELSWWRMLVGIDCLKHSTMLCTYLYLEICNLSCCLKMVYSVIRLVVALLHFAAAH